MMQNFKVVITDEEFPTIEGEKKVFSESNYDLKLYQCKTEKEVMEVTEDADGVIAQYAPITRKVIENMKKCKVIARYGVGFDIIDVQAATDNNIIVANVANYCIDEVSNHAMAFLLSLSKNINKLNKYTKKGEWDYKVAEPIYRLRGMTLGLLGFGKIAREVARKAQAFDLNVIVYDPYINDKIASENNVRLVDFDTILKNSDYISLHTPLNKHTNHIINSEALKKVKSNLNIINTSRGGLIDENALIDVLQKGKIAGAGLDVLEETPLKNDNPLIKMDNVIITPHSAFYSEASLLDLQKIAAEEVLRVLKGYYPENFVNRELKEKLDLKELSK